APAPALFPYPPLFRSSGPAVLPVRGVVVAWDASAVGLQLAGRFWPRRDGFSDHLGGVDSAIGADRGAGDAKRGPRQARRGRWLGVASDQARRDRGPDPGGPGRHGRGHRAAPLLHRRHLPAVRRGDRRLGTRRSSAWTVAAIQPPFVYRR